MKNGNGTDKEQAKHEKTHTLKLTFKAFKEVISADPSSGIFNVIFWILSAVASIIEVRLMGTFIDNIASFITGATAFSWDGLLASPIIPTFIQISLLYLAITIFNFGISYFETRLSDFFWNQYSIKSMSKMSTFNLEDIENTNIQNLISSVPTYSLNAAWDTYARVLNLIYQLIRFVGSGIVIATQMSLWGALVIFLIIPEAYFRHRYNLKLKKYRDANAEKYKYFDYLYTQSRLLPNFPELRVDNVFNFFIKSHRDVSLDYYNDQNRIIRKQNLVGGIWSWIDGQLRRIVQLMLIPIAIMDGYSIGTFKYLFDYIESLYNASWSVVWNWLNIKSNSQYVKDYFDLLDYQGFGDIASGETQLDKLKTPTIKFENVSFSYPNASSATINEISFEIKPGEKVAFIGRDNSGKSTIAKLLCGLYKIGPGDILIDEVSIKNLARGELKKKVSVVFENYVKYSFSLKKNIVLTQPERDFNRRLYEEALEITGLDKWKEELKIDDNQVLGKLFSHGMDISTGHWQRVAIARAIYRDCPVLILDESLTQIDGFSRQPILDRIIEHRPNQSFIYITQEDTNKDLFDKVIYLEKGTIKEVKEGKKEKGDVAKEKVEKTDQQQATS